MRAAFGVAATLATLALAGCDPRPPADEDPVAARTRLGPISFVDVERRLRDEIDASGTELTESVFERFRHVTEQLALERALLAEHTSAAAAEPGEVDRWRREIVGRLYLERNAPVVTPPTESELRADYDRQSDRWHRPAQLYAWHIYLRVRPDRPVAACRDLALEIRKRVEAGASFPRLARIFSDSETRLLGGRLGTVQEGRLPPELEKHLFALREGEVSPPIASRGGVFLFRATDVLPRENYAFEDVRQMLLAEALESRRDEAGRGLAGRAPASTDERVLDDDALALVGPMGDDEVILRIDGIEWTRRRLIADWSRARDLAPSNRPLEFSKFYRSLARLYRLRRAAADEGFEASHRVEIEQRTRRRRETETFRERLESELRAEAMRSPENLRRFFEDNASFYETTPRFRIRTLTIPLGGDPVARFARVAAARDEVLADGKPFADLAVEFEGELSSERWISTDWLASIDPKVRYYFLDEGTPGPTIPFQLNGRIVVIQILERVEPRRLPFDDVRTRVVEDYVERHRRELRTAVTARVLRRADFRFDEAAVRARLGGASPPAT